LLSTAVVLAREETEMIIEVIEIEEIEEIEVIEEIEEIETDEAGDQRETTTETDREEVFPLFEHNTEL